MRSKLNKDQPGQLGKFGGELEILFDRSVSFYIVDELRKHPFVEEGGKYIGYICKPGDSSLQKFDVNPRSHAIVITDFLPGGPKAVRTAAEFMPDGEYQEALFRQVEEIDPAIEHIGSWHTHHCNGLQTLSRGDVEGYFRTVNKAHYRPNYFFASLIKHLPINPESLDWIDHFLFVRSVNEYYLATGHVRVIDWPTTFGAHTGHYRQHRRIVALSSVNDAEVLQEQSSSVWYETEQGRNALAEDRRFFREQFGANVTTSRRDFQVTLTGHIEHKAISVSYPRNLEDKEITIAVLQYDAAILHMHCELSYRKISFAAALAAVRAL
jgi:hypothetical protein